MGRMEGLMLTRYDDVASALKHPRLVKNVYRVEGALERSKRPWIPGFLKALETTMLDQDDPEHARLRALVHRAFTPARIEGLRGRIKEIALDLINKVKKRGHLELVEDFALPLPLTVISELLGIPMEDRARFRRLAQGALLPPTSWNMVRALPAFYLLIRYIRRMLEDKKRSPKDDLLTGLVQAEEEGDHLSQDEQVGMVILLLIAGHETTVNLISSSMLALLTNPKQKDQLANHPEGIKTALEELLRFTSPVETSTERYAAEDLTFSSMRVKKGDLVLACIASANLDPEQFADPETLDLTREPNRHLAFGYGSHFCLGAPLARMEGQIGINLLLAELKNLRLSVPVESLRYRATPVVRGLCALPLSFG